MTTNDTIIFAYSRKDALRDGVLVDAGPMAKEAGFRIPVALTAAAWAVSVTVPDGVTGQDEAGRLWDVLSMLRFRIRLGGETASELRFGVYVRNKNDVSPQLVAMKSVCGPDDDGTPCLTIMLPEED